MYFGGSWLQTPQRALMAAAGGLRGTGKELVVVLYLKFCKLQSSTLRSYDGFPNTARSTERTPQLSHSHHHGPL